MNKIYIIGAGPGDPKLITVKAKELLEEADIVVYAGSLVNPVVLEYCRKESQLYDSAAMDLEEITRIMIDGIRRGKKVVRVQSGDPSIFGGTQEQMEVLAAEEIAFEIVPGVSSFQAAAAALQRELTIPEVAQTIIITRAKGRTPVPELEELALLASHKATMAIFLSAHLAHTVQEELLKHYEPGTPVAVVYKASWPDQLIFRGELKELATLVEENDIKKTALILVGPAFGAFGKRSKLYDKNFTHGYRTSKAD